jgi:AbrB family looped-hinge helix DNA binding protein
MTLYTRIQEKGQVTIPTKLRKRLNLKKGDTVMFVETREGLLLKPAEIILTEALDDIGLSAGVTSAANCLRNCTV